MANELSLTRNGLPVTLYPEVVTMINALIDNQEPIHKQGFGTITLDYLRGDVTFGLLRLNYKTKARKLI